MKIVKLNRKLIDDVVKIEEACFSHPWTYEQIEEYLGNPNAHFFIAVDDSERAVGYIGTYMVMDECFITNVGVLEDARSQGLGSELVKCACENAEKNGASFITLEVRKSNDIAIKIYEKNDFFREGVRPGFYRDPDEDGIIMTRRFK